MKVGYTEDIGGWVPLLQVTLRGPRGQRRIRALVDSGSMETTLPQRLVEQLGIELSNDTASLVGFGGHVTHGRVAQAEVQVADMRYVTRFVAVPDDRPAFPILGHRDFFLNFWVAFDAASRVFFVSPGRRR